MIITILSLKGGVGRTTTAIHLAAFLHHRANTLLIDADTNRSAIAWSKRGQLPFEVVTEWQTPDVQQPYEHVVIDTSARPALEELRVLVESSDLLVLPTTPDVMALDALVLLLEQLNTIQADRYRILLTFLPGKPNQYVEQVKTMLTDAHLPLFVAGIRNSSAFPKAAQAGIPVYEVKGVTAKEAWQDYEHVGQELLKI
jgi:chromosome partitioning protein